MRLDIYVHADADVQALLTKLLEQGESLVSINAQIQAKIDALTAEVAADRNVVTAAKTLLDGLTAQIAALRDQLNSGSDPAAVVAALDGILQGIDANKDALAAAVAANTPA